MPNDNELPTDPKALEAWENMPKNAPSKDAMPPMTGGTRWLWGVMLIFGLLALIAFLLEANIL